MAEHPICAIDIDVKDTDLAKRVSDYCQDELGVTVERVGNAPKTLLVYRASEEGWGKRSSQKFGDDRHQIEVLGKGQHFVAYAIHPDTGKPYEWVDFLGGLGAMQASELPVVNQEQITHVINAVSQIMVDAGYEPMQSVKKATDLGISKKDNDDFTANLPVGLTLKEAGELLEHLDASGYDRWVQVGMALHHEFGGSDDALVMWDSWSANADNYAGDDVIAEKWQSFADNKNGITARSLIKWGNDANKRHERDTKHAALDDYRHRINTAENIWALTDDVLTNIGRQIDKTDVVTAKAVRTAAAAKAKELGYPLTAKEIDSKLGLKHDHSQEQIDARAQLTEFGNAKRMLTDNKDRIMFVAETESWYVWDDSHWRKSTHIEIEAMAKQTVLGLLNDIGDLGVMPVDEQLQFARESMKSSMISNMVKLARSEADVLTKIEGLDKNKALFAAANCTIDLTTGQTYAPDPYDRITIATRVEYHADAKCDVWLQTLHDVFCGDQELIDFFQRLIGYTMLGSPTEDLIVIPYGNGSNGKSTVLGAIRDVFDNHAKTAANETFMSNKFGGSGGGPREDILRLMGSRFVYVSEPDEYSVLKEGLIKAMTGGEAMPARAAYAKATVEVIPTWTAFMPTNHKPTIKGDDHGIWRWLLPIPFLRNFDKDEGVTKDPNRAEKLLAERSGILTWCIRGALQYLQVGLCIPQVIQDAREEYKADMDLMVEWFEESCVIVPKEWASSAELWASWQAFAASRGELRFISSSRSLGKRLSGKGFTTFKNQFGFQGRGFIGISVKSGFEDVADETAKFYGFVGFCGCVRHKTAKFCRFVSFCG